MRDEGGQPTGAAGGCQCGAVRYLIGGAREDWHCTLCHCRMCRKAGGGPFMVFVNVARDAVSWTRGSRAIFASSSIAARGFCRDCGTPLTYERAPDRLSIAHGTLDDPTLVTPTSQLVGDAMLPWAAAVGALPRHALGAWIAALPTPPEDRQHPDHDT